jgi:hypothetical protein
MIRNLGHGTARHGMGSKICKFQKFRGSERDALRLTARCRALPCPALFARLQFNSGQKARNARNARNCIFAKSLQSNNQNIIILSDILIPKYLYFCIIISDLRGHCSDKILLDKVVYQV